MTTFITLVITIVLLQALMVGWIQVQRAARRVAAQHPETGPLRLIGGGCGGHGHGKDSDKVSLSSPVVPLARADGCAACENTACKPGMLTEAGAPASCATGAQTQSSASRFTS